MNTVRLRQVEIGSGRPKVVVPIVGDTQEEILAQARELCALAFDVAEWRVDFFRDASDAAQVVQTLGALRAVLGEIPILFTFRTRREGGERELTMEQYTALNAAAAQSGYADAVDVEIFSGDDVVRENIRMIHAAGAAVVGSNHEFGYTPSQEELVARLNRAQELGCDILKIAVMPRSRRDVLTLLSATEEMYTHHAHQPIVTMSMAGTGAISRLCGEVFGSAMTFGAAGRVSAPGQVPVEQLNTALEIIHSAMGEG